jgi:hypothetical protein
MDSRRYFRFQIFMVRNMHRSSLLILGERLSTKKERSDPGNAILYACTHNTAYDPQCEDSCEKYLWGEDETKRLLTEAAQTYTAVLMANDILPDWMAKECLYDSNIDIRERDF